jgi:small subunit ribosomal protein S2
VGFIKNLCATGQQVVLVGTKRQIKSIVESEAKRCSMPYVTERWLGGTLTNFQTIRARLKRLEQLEDLESTGKLALYSKKIQSSLLRELRKIKKNLDGIREMHRLPGALVVIDPKNENIAVKEANKLGLPVIAVLDTDCDPEEIDIPIPGNDDAIRSVQVLLEKMVDAVNEGKANYDEKAAMAFRAEEAEEQFELASERRRAAQASRTGFRKRGPGKPRVDKIQKEAAPAVAAVTGAPKEAEPKPESKEAPESPVAPKEPKPEEAHEPPAPVAESKPAEEPGRPTGDSKPAPESSAPVDAVPESKGTEPGPSQAAEKETLPETPSPSVEESTEEKESQPPAEGATGEGEKPPA